MRVMPDVSPDFLGRRAVEAKLGCSVEFAAWFRLVGRGPALPTASTWLQATLLNWLWAHRRARLPSHFFVVLDDDVMSAFEVQLTRGSTAVKRCGAWRLDTTEVIERTGWEVVLKQSDGRVVAMRADHESVAAADLVEALLSRTSPQARG